LLIAHPRHGSPQPPSARGLKASAKGWTIPSLVGLTPELVLPRSVVKRQLTAHRLVTLSASGPQASQHGGLSALRPAFTRASAQVALTTAAPASGDASRHQQLESSSVWPGLHSPTDWVLYQLPYTVPLFTNTRATESVLVERGFQASPTGGAHARPSGTRGPPSTRGSRARRPAAAAAAVGQSGPSTWRGPRAQARAGCRPGRCSSPRVRSHCRFRKRGTEI
jgi:hypothetical protein